MIAQSTLKQYFPGINWDIAEDKATAQIGCFSLSVQSMQLGFYSDVSCFSGQGMAPVFRSTDMGGQSLDSALQLLSNWCREQGELMVNAIKEVG